MKEGLESYRPNDSLKEPCWSKKYKNFTFFYLQYYICTMYENPGGAAAAPLPTPMVIGKIILLWRLRRLKFCFCTND